MKIKFIFFDAGNTILRLNYEYIYEVLSKRNIPVTFEDIIYSEYKARVLTDRILEKNMETTFIFKKYMEFIMEGLEGKYNIEFKNKNFGEIFEEISNYNNENCLWSIPDEYAEETLVTLSKNNYRMGVISNADGRIEMLLREAGFSQYLDVIIDSTVVGIEKPDVEIFNLALKEAKVLPSETIYVGDIYSIDVVGSENAGMKGVLLDPANEWKEVNCIKVKNIKEFAERLISGRLFLR